jgi:short-subunit dehydrogenase
MRNPDSSQDPKLLLSIIIILHYRHQKSINSFKDRGQTTKRAEYSFMIAPYLRNAVALGTTAFALAFVGLMDADPSLYLYDRFFVNDQRLKSFFEGKTIWITGASSGIGRELALRASRYGVKNLILTGRSSERLQIVADCCSDQNKEFLSSDSSPSIISVLPLDMTAPEEEFNHAVSLLENLLGDDNLDCVMLNAGRGQLKPADRTSSSTTAEVFQINALAPIALTQQLLERGILKKKRGRQQLGVTSSVGALVGLPLSSSYAASKHALHGYYNTLRSENTWLDIQLICPGTIDTSFHSSYVGGSEPGAEIANHSSTDDKNQTRKKSNKLKMSIDRCVRLYMSSLLLRNGEYWIAEQPMLSGLYINRHFPGIFQALLAKVGTLRIKAWEEGKDLYDPKTWKEIGRKK